VLSQACQGHAGIFSRVFPHETPYT
jgi:hypothetical protein